MSKIITFRVTDEEKEKLDKLAEELGITVSQLLRKGVKEAIKMKEQPKEEGSFKVSSF